MDCEFANSYGAARRRFQEAARGVGAIVESIISPQTGPEGEELSVDIAALGDADGPRVFFLCSGTHGVEGFAGSALQTGLMNQSRKTSISTTGVRIVLIHALNPFGFAWLRRFTEENVDLNRNFAAKGAHAPVNEGYQALAGAIAPASISTLPDLRALARVLSFAAKHGMGATKQAITGGQFSHPEGLFYGGREPSWSAKTLEHILSNYGRHAGDVVFLDVHTGLGKFATSEIILNSEKGTPEWVRATEIWPGRVKTTRAAGSVSADLSGTLKLAVPRFLPGGEATAASIEFGTFSAIRVLRALRAENWLHHFGDPRSPEGMRMKADLKTAFCPDDPGWRAEVCRQGLRAVDQALKWLEAR